MVHFALAIARLRLRRVARIAALSICLLASAGCAVQGGDFRNLFGARLFGAGSGFGQAGSGDLARAESLVRAGDLSDAKRIYMARLAESPRDRIARLGVAMIALLEGEHAIAEVWFKALLNEDAADIAALNGLGVTYDQLGRHEEAQQSYAQVLQIDAGNAIALHNLAASQRRAAAQGATR
ncbi:MAG: hypothetical protein AAGM38_12265 [Pseudomonadota bacterium]